MALLTRRNICRLFAGLCVLFLILNFLGFKTQRHPSFSSLSVRRVHKYDHVLNGTDSRRWPSAPLALTRDRHRKSQIRNSTVIKSNITSIPQDLNRTITRDIPKTHEGFATTLHKATYPPHSVPLKQCKEPEYQKRYGGPIKPNLTVESLDFVDNELGPYLFAGGEYLPEDCEAKHHVAIIVPFRDRYAHLSIFLRNLHPFLMKQNIAYRIFVVEQTNGKPFNRAALMNIGYLEAIKLFKWDCFIFHDVDLLPVDERNIYNCPRQPRHMSVAIDTLNYKLPYRTIFGGVSAMTTEQMQKVNGFSNSFFGWGGEDDDMSNRLKHLNYYISRYPINVARYIMLKHQKEKANPKRYENLVNGVAKMEIDGLNSIEYDIYDIKEFPTFTWFMAEIKNKVK